MIGIQKGMRRKEKGNSDETKRQKEKKKEKERKQYKGKKSRISYKDNWPFATN